MAKFNFGLQPVLNIKKQTEESVKNELGKAVYALEAEKNFLKDLIYEEKRCMLEVSAGVSSGLTVAKLRNYNAYISFIKQKISNQSEKVKYAQENADNIREGLIKITKEKRMLEVLREKQYAEYLKEEEKKEQKRVDEIISYKESMHKKLKEV